MTLANIWELKKIALRNLARHKIKTIITILAITVSVTVYIFMDGMLAGMSMESRRNIVNYEIGAAKLQTKLYFEKKDELPAYEVFSGWETYRDVLGDGGYDAAPRYVFSGTLYSVSGSAPMIFNAVDPEAEAKVLRYTPYMEFGRYVKKGAIELVLGTVAAEKLKVGIPQRPALAELEELAREAAKSPGEQAFILSLYEPIENQLGDKGYALFDVQETKKSQHILRKNIPPEDLERFWNILGETGRRDAQISAVIDIKAAPETVRSDKWEGELLPALGPGDRVLVEAAYQYEDFLDAYLLKEEYEKDNAKQNQVLEAMIRGGFSGALRHVNQLIPAVVVGVVNSPDPVTNGNTAYIPLDALQGEEGMMLEGNVTELLIREKNAREARLPGETETAPAITGVLEKGLAAQGLELPRELAVFTWMDYAKDYLGYEAMENGTSRILTLLLFLLAFLGISNTILLAILERTKEIGMMRALGMTDAQMKIVFMLEAGFLGFFGSVLGIILGCLANYPMVKYGIDISAMGEALGGGVGFRVTTLFRSMWNIPVIIGSGVTATLLSSFMAFFPIRRALKMPITESLRFE